MDSFAQAVILRPCGSAECCLTEKSSRFKIGRARLRRARGKAISCAMAPESVALPKITAGRPIITDFFLNRALREAPPLAREGAFAHRRRILRASHCLNCRAFRRNAILLVRRLIQPPYKDAIARGAADPPRQFKLATGTVALQYRTDA